MKINKKDALYVAKKFGIDLDVIPIDQLIKGLNVELEHGSRLGELTDITSNNLITTAKIVLAHLIEDPYYYKYLLPMEKRRERYWKHRNKPSVFRGYIH